MGLCTSCLSGASDDDDPDSPPVLQRRACLLFPEENCAQNPARSLHNAEELIAAFGIPTRIVLQGRQPRFTVVAQWARRPPAAASNSSDSSIVASDSEMDVRPDLRLEYVFTGFSWNAACARSSALYRFLDGVGLDTSALHTDLRVAHALPDTNQQHLVLVRTAFLGAQQQPEAPPVRQDEVPGRHHWTLFWYDDERLHLQGPTGALSDHQVNYGTL